MSDENVGFFLVCVEGENSDRVTHLHGAGPPRERLTLAFLRILLVIMIFYVVAEHRIITC